MERTKDGEFGDLHEIEQQIELVLRRGERDERE
jgi:hypothetical protein